MLTPAEIDATLNVPQYSKEKSKTRETIDQMRDDFASGQGVLPTVLGGAAAVPALLSTIKIKQPPVNEIPL